MNGGVMGFLDNLKGMAESALGADQHNALATAAAETLGHPQNEAESAD